MSAVLAPPEEGQAYGLLRLSLLLAVSLALTYLSLDTVPALVVVHVYVTHADSTVNRPLVTFASRLPDWWSVCGLSAKVEDFFSFFFELQSEGGLAVRD